LSARLLWVLGVFAVLLAFLAVGLTRNPREVPSPLIGKPAPDFVLPSLQAPDKMISAKDQLGKVWVLNVWASWCVACREEHPLLVDFAKGGAVQLVGLNYKDKREDGLAWLKRYGDPYRFSIYDLDGKVGIDYGVYGVPETYVIDKRGVIRYKRIGAVTPELMAKTVVPLVKELERE
jgi:cytochrome c biogenesis protein CcmG/thiol:disulfide interchange protein DsbE